MSDTTVVVHPPPKVKRGEYRLIRVDGIEVTIAARPTMSKIHAALGCSCTNTIILTRNGDQAGIVMLVDDTGTADGKPINLKATELYHRVCKPGTTACIHGDVAIVNDEDFA